MDELVGIVIALIAMFLGLWGIGWAYGDFRKDSPTPPPSGQGQKPA